MSPRAACTRPEVSADGRAQPEGERRVRLRQPDRADACRPWPRRRVRRRAGLLLAFTATMSPANTTSTTPAPRSTCSRARPSCATARLSARHRPDPGRPLSGRLPKPVGAALPRDMGARCWTSRGRMAAARPRDGHRRHDGDDPRRPRGARHRPRRVLLRAFPDQALTAARSRDHREPARPAISSMTGRLAPPKGQSIDDWEDRDQTLFRATAFRRRCRPAAAQIGRLLHLFRRRHRLSSVEVRARLHRR